MTEWDDSDAVLGPEQEQLLEERLAAQRPVPAPGFRGTLGRVLAASDPGYGPRPEHLRRTVAVCVGGGTFVMALGLLQAVGAL